MTMIIILMIMITWFWERAKRSGGREKQEINLRRIIKQQGSKKERLEGTTRSQTNQTVGERAIKGKEIIKIRETKTARKVGKETAKSQTRNEKTKVKERGKRARIMEMKQIKKESL